MISARTKAALAAAKKNRGAKLSAKARAAGRAALQARAQERAADLTETVKELQAVGCESLRAIAAGWTRAASLPPEAAIGPPCRSRDCSEGYRRPIRNRPICDRHHIHALGHLRAKRARPRRRCGRPRRMGLRRDRPLSHRRLARAV
jgi:hypothetical protein